ncbi:hypothetical protein F4678DRAFT_460877 [Xylaria arbuscula]|nr:hypothetical protein F4678DRAFT_460877 [Xylaria arbuscula]
MPNYANQRVETFLLLIGFVLRIKSAATLAFVNIILITMSSPILGCNPNTPDTDTEVTNQMLREIPAKIDAAEESSQAAPESLITEEASTAIRWV